MNFWIYSPLPLFLTESAPLGVSKILALVGFIVLVSFFSYVFIKLIIRATDLDHSTELAFYWHQFLSPSLNNSSFSIFLSGIFKLILDCLNIAVDESESQCSCKLFQQKCKQGDENSLKIIMQMGIITLSDTLKYFLDQEGEVRRWG